MKYVYDIESNYIHNAAIYPDNNALYPEISKEEAVLLKASGVGMCSCCDLED